MDLFFKIREFKANNEALPETLIEFIKTSEIIPKDKLGELNKIVQIFISKVKNKLKKYCRNYEKFLKYESNWLGKNLIDYDVSSHPRPGRPIKEWGDLCERSKRAKIADLANEHHVALTLAASKSAKAAEEKDSAYILKRTSKCVDVVQMRRSIDSLTQSTMKLEEALALKTQTYLSDIQYQMLRNSALSHNVKIYPSLNKLGEEMLKCYLEGVQFTEMPAKCSLQSMLNHTVTRIINMIDLSESYKVEMNGILYVKIGFDGTSSQSIYKQKFDSHKFTEELLQEDSLFSTAIVPLLFKIENIDFWKNSKCSSCHFCRPLHLQYKKERSALCKEEETDRQTQISQLKPFSTDLNIAGTVITIKTTFKIDMTMFDGKVINSD